MEKFGGFEGLKELAKVKLNPDLIPARKTELEEELERFTNPLDEEKRWVYGTRSERWELVGQDDRDFACGITVTEMAEIGEAAAKEKYLRARPL